MSATTPQLPVIVSEVVDVTPQVKRFRLEPAGLGPLPAFAGGAHVVVSAPDGQTVHRRAYSLMSPPSQTASYMISVRRDDTGRGASRHMHERVGVGARLAISHPVNLFPIAQRAEKHLLLAGGIGITPFLAMMHQLNEQARPFELHYAARSQDEAAYAAEIQARYGHHARFYHSNLGERLPLATILANQPLGTHVYVCGPRRMLEDATQTAAACGWPDPAVHCERFGAPPGGEAFEVRLRRSRIAVQVGAHQSMLEAIEAAGVPAPSLCRGGACGQCEARVLACDGALLHHDHVLTADDKAAGHKIMPCVSRFIGRSLVIDL